MLAAKTLDVGHQVKCRVIGGRNLSIDWEKVEVTILRHLLAMSDDGKEESCFIVRGPLESRPDCALRFGDRRVDHKCRGIKRGLTGPTPGIDHHFVQPGGHLRQEGEFRETRALGANDKKIAPAHAGIIRVSTALGKVGASLDSESGTPIRPTT
jgi:hypothetical protein